MTAMLSKQDFKRIAPLLWEVPTSFQQGMRVPVRLFADERLLEAALGDKSLQQAINASTLPRLASRIPLEAVEGLLPDLATALYANCPSGVGVKGSVRLSAKDLDQVCRRGAEWALAEGYADQEDLDCTEESG